ncbi:MAG: hypothetical protein Ta2A_09860 [Treponemataceae bacterium]|nr:MAG: hypothetical protein Ta2A_09860 [Treponemataceae bacterium]
MGLQYFDKKLGGWTDKRPSAEQVQNTSVPHGSTPQHKEWSSQKILKAYEDALRLKNLQSAPQTQTPTTMSDIINNAVESLFPDYIKIVDIKIKVDIKKEIDPNLPFAKIQELIANKERSEFWITKPLRDVVNRIDALKATGEIGDTYEFVKTYLKGKDGSELNRRIATLKSQNKANDKIIL